MNRIELKNRTDRDSNVELLRLLCMLMVVLHHFLIAGPSIGAFKSSPITHDSLIAAFINPFLYCAVNTFVLISGYYGIRFKVKGVVSLYVRCAWYGTLCYLLHLLIDGASPGIYGLTHNCIFALSNSRWFILNYVCLYLLSPALNALIDTFDERRFSILLIVLSLINLYFGWVWGNGVNYNGYNLSQFIFLYYIGRYLALYHTPMVSMRWRYLGVYVACAALLGLVCLLLGRAGQGNYLLHLMGECYNNPILIIEAIALLYFFKTFSFKSRIINYCAFSVLAVYLIHQNVFIEGYIKDYLSSHFFVWGEYARWLVLLFGAIMIFVACLVVDIVCKWVYMPIANVLTNWSGQLELHLLPRSK